MAKPANTLAVTSKTIETVYREYLEGAYGVNRRYQRKLVWTVQEKQSLIDSVLRQFPLPQFLVAEAESSSDFRFEIIDGMQRLNAIMAFIENEFPLSSECKEYFDLEALASTKKLRDEGILVQMTPVLDRSKSVAIATYEIAQSVYRTSDKASVEEVFRRINSSGQKLSLQDLRQAGSTSPISELVQDLASRIRGDYSRSDVVPLSGMKALSIASANNEYGISPDSILWVKQGILGRPGVRSSGDEQLILDIVADMIFHPLLNTGTPVRDQLFQVESFTSSEETGRRIADELAKASWLSGRKKYIAGRFMQTMDRINRILESMPPGVTFKKHIGTKGNNPVPRYFEATFAAVYRILFEEGRDLSNPALAVQLLNNAAPFKQMPSGGGEWPADKKEEIISSLQRELKHAFDMPFDESGGISLSDTMSGSDFDTLISGILLESSGRDVKQGFLTLNPRKREFDGECFAKIMQTLTAISNSHPADGGYVIVGIADSENDAKKVESLDSLIAASYRSLKIVGLDREAAFRGETIDKYWDAIIKKIASHSKLPTEYAHRVAVDSKVAAYEGKTMFVLAAPSVNSPVPYNGNEYYSRVAASTEKTEDPVRFGMEFHSRLREN